VLSFFLREKIISLFCRGVLAGFADDLLLVCFSSGAGGGFGFLLLPLASFLLGSHGAQLESVDAVLLGHLVAEKGVDHAVTGGLHLGVEGI
jgi:hypothetical protein